MQTLILEVIIIGSPNMKAGKDKGHIDLVTMGRHYKFSHIGSLYHLLSVPL